MAGRDDVTIFFEKSISPNSSTTIDFHSDITDDNGVDVNSYAPYNNIEVINNTSNADIVVFRNNQKSGKYVPAGVIKEYINDTTRRITVTNQNATNTAEVIIMADNKETKKKLLKKIEKKI